MSSDFYNSSILPYAAIIIKICRAYTDTEQDFEDYYQEVCLQIWRSREKFNGQSKWSTWIYRLSLNVCITLFRKKQRANEQIGTEKLTHKQAVSNGAFADESLNMLYDAIRELSEVDKAVILLYLEEKTYQEIAEIMGSNPNNIGVRIKRIKQRLKKIIDGKIDRINLEGRFSKD